MTTAQDPAIANALIDWVHTFNLPHNAAYISSLSKLYDGSIISLILADIDSPYFGDGIVKGRSAGTAASVNWVQHFNALKKLLRNMTDYYSDVLKMNPPNLPPEEQPNLSNIAKEQSIPDIVKFLRLVLALAVKSDKKEDYVQKIYTLSPEAQKALMYLLQQVVSDPSPGYASGNGMNEDDQIRLEQEIAEISAERDAVEKSRLMVLDELEKSKAEIKRLQGSLDAALTRAHDAEEAARSLGSKADSWLRSELDRVQLELQDVEAKSQQKDTLLETRNTLITGLNRQIDELRPLADQATRFEEELKETTSELAQTHKKVLRLENIVEKYKAKAEESNVLLRQNDMLEDENTHLKETLRRNDIYQSPLKGKGESGRLEILQREWSDEKRELELEVDRLKERLKTAEEQSARDVGVIAALEERVKESSGRSPEIIQDIDGEGLDDEMNTSRKSLRMQIIRLEQDLAAVKAEAEFNKVALQNGTETDVHERFVKYESELSAANRKIADLTLLVSQSSKSNTSNDLQELLQKQTELEDDKQKLTREKDELQQELSKLKDHLLENERDSSRIKSSLAALEGEAGGQTKGEVLQLQKSIREQTSEVKLKEAEIQKLKDLVRKQDQKLKEGKAKLAKAEASADQSIRDENSELSKKLQTAKKSHREELALKNKEIQMIASAFHDLASRTQLNSFVVEKQAQGPSSFLAQQRSSIHSLSKKD